MGLLFRLNIDRRADEIGLLLAVGYRRAAVRRLLLGEGCVLAAAGAVVGTCLAMLYARLLLANSGCAVAGKTLQSFLRPHFEPLSLVGGAGGAFLVSVLTVVWAVFSLGRVAQRVARGTNAGRRRETRPTPAALELVDRWRIAHRCLGFTRRFGPRAGPRNAGHDVFRQRQLTAHRLSRCPIGMDAEHALSHRRRPRTGERRSARHSQRRPPSRSQFAHGGMLASAAFLLVAVEAFRRKVDAHEAVMRANGGYGRGRVGPIAVPRFEYRRGAARGLRKARTDLPRGIRRR